MRVDVDKAEAYKWGQIIAGVHKGNPTEVIMGHDGKPRGFTNIVGFAGELACEDTYGWPATRNPNIKSDGGVDHKHTPLGPVEIKTSSDPEPYILVRAAQVDKGLAHFVLFLHYKKELEKTIWMEFLGFSFAEYIEQWPRRDFGYDELTAYARPSELKPMWIFNHLLKWAKKLRL